MPEVQAHTQDEVLRAKTPVAEEGFALDLRVVSNASSRECLHLEGLLTYFAQNTPRSTLIFLQGLKLGQRLRSD